MEMLQRKPHFARFDFVIIYSQRILWRLERTLFYMLLCNNETFARKHRHFKISAIHAIMRVLKNCRTTLHCRHLRNNSRGINSPHVVMGNYGAAKI